MADASPPQTVAPVSLIVAGNQLTLLTEGPELLEALLALINEAKESLRLLYYMFLDDVAGRQVREALLEATKRGVSVSLLVDGFGSDTAKAAFFQPLVDSKVDFCRFSARFGRRYLLRNHQKLALADGNRVIIGGFNISDEYFGTIESGAWRDLGLEVRGDSVSCLIDYYDRLLDWTQTPKARIRELRRMLRQHSLTDGSLKWLFGGPTRRLSPWARALRRDMFNAKRLDMIAAYFAPAPAILRRIASISRSGGSARVITAAKSDNNATIGAARSTYWWLLKRGVRIFEYQPTKLHTKLFVVDDVVHIGSANFDMRSLFLNLEMMLRIDDAEFAAAMRNFVEGELANCEEITREKHNARRNLFNRLRWGAAYFIVAVADYNISRRLNFGLNGK